MTDREVINIKFQSKRLAMDALDRLEILFLSSNVFLFSLELITLSLVSDMFVWERAHSNSVNVKYTQYLQYIINRSNKSLFQALDE